MTACSISDFKFEISDSLRTTAKDRGASFLRALRSMMQCVARTGRNLPAHNFGSMVRSRSCCSEVTRGDDQEEKAHRQSDECTIGRTRRSAVPAAELPDLTPSDFLRCRLISVCRERSPQDACSRKTARLILGLPCRKHCGLNSPFCIAEQYSDVSRTKTQQS